MQVNVFPGREQKSGGYGIIHKLLQNFAEKTDREFTELGTLTAAWFVSLFHPTA
jgi:hypothetical protein